MTAKPIIANKTLSLFTRKVIVLIIKIREITRGKFKKLNAKKKTKMRCQKESAMIFLSKTFVWIIHVMMFKCGKIWI